MAFIPLKRIRFHYLRNQVNESAYQRYMKDTSIVLHVRLYSFLLFMTYEKDYKEIHYSNEELAEKFGCYTRKYRRKKIMLERLKESHEELRTADYVMYDVLDLTVKGIIGLERELKELEKSGEKYSISGIQKSIKKLEKERLIYSPKIKHRIQMIESTSVNMNRQYRGKIRFLRVRKKYAEKLMSIFQYTKSKINACKDTLHNMSIRMRKFVKYRIFSLVDPKKERPGEFEYYINKQRENRYMKGYIRKYYEPDVDRVGDCDDIDNCTENRGNKNFESVSKKRVTKQPENGLKFIITDSDLPF